MDIQKIPPHDEDAEEAVIGSMLTDKDAVIAAIESRTSSPVRIERDDYCESNIKGIYPCGEGAGYAGGITSAAMDGVLVAECIAKKYKNFS